MSSPKLLLRSGRNSLEARGTLAPINKPHHLCSQSCLLLAVSAQVLREGLDWPLHRGVQLQWQGWLALLFMLDCTSQHGRNQDPLY